MMEEVEEEEGEEGRRLIMEEGKHSVGKDVGVVRGEKEGEEGEVEGEDGGEESFREGSREEGAFGGDRGWGRVLSVFFPIMKG